MAEPLKNRYGPEIPRKISAMVLKVYPAFDSAGFIKDALQGYETLNLMQRGRKIAHTLKTHLPQNYEKAVGILLRSLGERPLRTGDNPLSSFIYMPHTFFVADYGLASFEASMEAQYELTKRFTAEFSIRAFLTHHEKQTLARLKIWARDRDEHVRRLVSEGTRPRLPWAPRLPAFQKNPGPVLELLEMLKDDPALYVRRSVANNLNDIGKDHPDILAETCRYWLKNAPQERQWLIRHGLRSAVKRGESGALDVLGYGKAARVVLQSIRISPKNAVRGASVRIGVEIVNPEKNRQNVLADLCIHFVKANGKSSKKVFKLNTYTLLPGQSVACGKKISLADLTTRKHYPGKHQVEILLNGKARPLGTFVLT